MSLALPRYYSAWEREQYGIEYGQEETEWYNLEIWGALAEFAVKNIEKGARIGVVGAIDTDYYPNKDTGVLSTNPKLLVQDIDILESKMEADARRNKNNNSNYGNNNNNNNSYSGGGGYGGGGGGGNSNPNRNYNNNSNNNNYGNGNGNGGQQQRQQERGPSFYTADNDNDDDDDDDDDDMYDPSRGGGSAGGFFDPM
ncbi:nucleic acid-binding protein [Fragilariopsis cylindrus CCMP1102]|uniref:Nucleic acid-binding protein n=1 Tax=Fragilariopsis cylindrus CCMP1102 TaxID=635003 RepID=A0A1E7F6J2_9STRA|nr:nucleic acid-binding protein [Fragilariopsis cylindrus CCMP1102]|eukprot:OEU13625.1 nucleic acid-binding protein [Fragilariopsis cylindrus CCMP1102]